MANAMTPVSVLQTLGLAEVDILKPLHIQNQFIGQSIQYPLESCQLFYIHVILKDGWTLHMWDMLRRLIHVLDPCCGPDGITDLNKESHELIASHLHDALFGCLNAFFA